MYREKKETEKIKRIEKRNTVIEKILRIKKKKKKIEKKIT